MRILAFDTSTEYLSLALWHQGTVLSRDTHARQSHSTLILPQIGQMLAQQQCALSDLDAIAFGAGPGSFTGLRIACGVAQGLAYAHQLPVLPVCTLHALAAQSEADRVIACLDARMGEVYLAAYARDANGAYQEVLSPCLARPEHAPALEGDAWVGVGTGWQAYPAGLQQSYGQQLAEQGVQAHVCYPSAATIASIAVQDYQRGLAVPAEQASPLYVRDKVAFTTQERQAQ